MLILQPTAVDLVIVHVKLVLELVLTNVLLVTILDSYNTVLSVIVFHLVNLDIMVIEMSENVNHVLMIVINVSKQTIMIFIVNIVKIQNIF